MLCRARLAGCVLFNLVVAVLSGPLCAEPQATNLLKRLAQRIATSKQYSFQGRLELSRKVGEAPLEIRAQESVEVLVAPGGRFRFLEKGDKALVERQVVSNGATKWTYLPGSSQYSEQKSTPQGSSTEKLDLNDSQRFCTEVFSAIRKLPAIAQTTFYRGAVLTVLSKQDERGRQTLVYITLNPDTLTVSRITWMQALEVSNRKDIERGDLQFTNLQLDDKTAAEGFVFHPPDGAVAVPELPPQKKTQ